MVLAGVKVGRDLDKSQVINSHQLISDKLLPAGVQEGKDADNAMLY